MVFSAQMICYTKRANFTGKFDQLVNKMLGKLEKFLVEGPPQINFLAIFTPTGGVSWEAKKCTHRDFSVVTANLQEFATQNGLI